MSRRRSLAMLACVGLFVAVGACTPQHGPRLTDRGEAREATHKAAPPPEAATAQPKTAILDRVDDWIETQLLAEPLPVHSNWGDSVEVNNPKRLWGLHLEPCEEAERVRHLTKAEVCLFIEAGPIAVASLLPHIRNASTSRISFMHPRCSQYMREPLLVGELACYMIEAAMRGQECFGFAPELEFTVENIRDDIAVHQARAAALNEAAAQYEQWYAASMQRAVENVQASPIALPPISWQSYMGSWGTCRHEHKFWKE